MPHDAVRQLTYIRQALESDKRPLALFLGAGCPQAIRIEDGEYTVPLIPDIDGLMTITSAAIAPTDLEQAYAALKGHFTEDGIGEPNVETLLSHIRSLRAVAGAGAIRGVTAGQLDGIEKIICDEIAKAVDKPLPSTATPYHSVAAWIGGLPRFEAIELFTTNYDLLMEQALEETRTPYFDGFVGARQPFFDIAAIEDDALPPRWARLWKIHGSINWTLGPNETVSRSSSSVGTQLIYPSHLKYEQSRRMPYLAMLDRLKNFLRRPSAVLVLAGYSFRDDHINEVITQGLQGNPTAMAFGLLFGPLATYRQGVRLAERRVNLTLLARDRAVMATRADAYATAAPSPPLGVHHTEGAGGEQVTQVGLGDFANFAEFLRDLTGQTRIPEAL